MKVVLLGASGQLGTDIREAASRSDSIQLIAITRDKLDVRDGKAVAQALQELAFDVLVNCTAYNSVDEAETNTTLAFDVNAHAVGNLAEACARVNARLVHFSTDYVFGGDSARSRPYAERDSTAPLNVYGASKAMGETLALLNHPNVLVLRVASLFGVAGARSKGGNFVDTMVRLSGDRTELRVVDDQRMSPTATTDVASTVLALIQSQASAGIYHVVNSGDASWYEFTCAIVAALHRKTHVVPVSSAEFPRPARRPSFSILDATKLTHAIGPMPHWQDALQRYLRAKGYQ